MKMNCPICYSELSKKWQPPQNIKSALAPRGQWSCGVCGGAFTRLEIQAAGKPVIAASSPSASPIIAPLAVPTVPKPISSDEDEVSETQVSVLA